MRDVLARLAAASPSSTALQTADGAAVTFADLDALADDVAARLPSGGGRAAVLVANDIPSVAAIHGVWRAGAAVVVLSRHLPEGEAHRRLTEVGARAVVTPDQSGTDVEALAASARPESSGEAVVMFTSGTTGRPKAASLTFAALQASVRGIATANGLPPDGRPHRLPSRGPQVTFVPLAHMGGLLSTLTSWWLGKPLLLCPKFSVPLLAQVVREHRVGTLGGTPAMFYELARWPEPVELPGVTLATVGTAPLPESTRLAFEGRFGIPMLRNYGSTEFAGAIAFERPADLADPRRVPDSVGRLAPGVEVRVVDPDDREVPSGHVGEIVARSGSSMSGYLDSRGHPAGESPDGWIHTGDLGVLDDSGLLRVVGRVKEVVICGGFNVYPAQVEAALNRVDGVVDSAVAGVPDDRLGEIPVAVAVVVPGSNLAPQAITLRLRGELPPYELPRHIVLVPAIPRHESGKVDRAAVAALVRSCRTE